MEPGFVAGLIRAGELTQAEARALRRGGTRVTHGVYAEAAEEAKSLDLRARAAMSVSPAGTVVTGVTTFALAGIELPDLSRREAEGRIHLVAPDNVTWAARRPGVVTHRRAQHCAQLVHRATGLRTASISDSWVDAVRRLGSERKWTPWETEPAGARGTFDSPSKRVFLEAVQLGDALVRRRHAWTRVAQLATCAELCRGAGSRLVRAAVKQVRAGTDSFMETWLRLVVWDAGFPEPAINHEIKVGGRRRLLDLSWPDRRIALEYQGRQHFSDESQAYDDMVRRGQLQHAGWTIHEAAHKDLLDPLGLLARLSRSFGW
jgi:very-short-patch-repair endonuclease